MRDLEIDIVKIVELPLDAKNCKRFIQVDNKSFVLNDTIVHTIENESNVVIKKYATSIDWLELENILCMGDGSSFECYKVDLDVSTVIDIIDGFVIHKWSPSKDRIALITNKKILQIVQFTPDTLSYIEVARYTLESDEPSPFIDIGWGSRKTQFRGSEGQTTEISDGNATAEILDDSYSIAWRADGELFAVSFMRNAVRVFKVFSMNCEFRFESEHKVGLCSQIAWKPNSNLIAGEQRILDQHKIIFFEKNGLYRFDFKLSRNMNVSKIEWNQLGDILMVWQHDCDESNAVSDEIALWTCSNWNWTQKQSLVFNRVDPVNYVEWHDTGLQVITVKHLLNYSWNWIIHQSIQHESLGEMSKGVTETVRPLGAITVIDGSKLRVTITVEAMLPPPMSEYDIIFDCQVNHVVFGSESNVIAVVLNEYTVHIVELTEVTFNRRSEYNICGKMPIPFRLNHFVYRDSHAELYCIESLSNGASFVNKYTHNTTVSESKCILSPECITNLMRVNEPQSLGFHLALCKGALTSLYHTKPNTSSIYKDLDLADAHKSSSDRGGQTTVNYILGQYHVFTLFENKLYIDSDDSGWNITSFLIWRGHILLTTESALYCVPLTESALTEIKSKNIKEAYKRTIPAGALLVIAIPGTRQIVLQVPRGDLETICPRVLAINEIDRLISLGKYMQAYEIARTDRINLNIFYDLNPPRFLANIESFVKDINNCEYLVIFLTQLCERNITDELFSECLTEQPIYDRSAKKLELIIQKMIEVMKRVNYDFYLQPIVTAYIRLGTDDALDQAALEILEGKTRGKSIDMHISPDAILNHMIIMTSVEKMYDIALGLNNVNFIMWVASKSHKDPREYIPFLVDLGTMEPEYRLYKINRHIKRYETALTHLIKCDNIQEELTEFVEEECLHVLLIKYATPANQWYKTMLCMYKDYLCDKKQYSDAGYLCLNIKDYADGLNMFLNALQVQEYIYCLKKLDLGNVKTNIALIEMKNRLIGKKNYKEASYIFETHLKNYEDAIAVLLLGRLWCDAQYLCRKYDRDDLIECEVLPTLLEYVKELKQTIESAHQEYITLKTRLQIVRQQKQQFLEQDRDINNGGVQLETGVRDTDLRSIAASTIQTKSKTSRTRSTSSKMSTSTSKQLRRLERKKIQMREGSAYENIAIVRRLHILITDMQNLSETVTDTCRVLVLFNHYYDKAYEVQTAYETTINFMYLSIEEIWPPEMLIPSNPMTSEAIVFLHNLEHLDLEYRYPPPDLRKKWTKLLL